MKYPFLISLPHCSSSVPDEIQSYFALDENEILESEDFFKELADYFFRIFLCRWRIRLLKTLHIFKAILGYSNTVSLNSC